MAHEMGHVRNRDILIGTIAATIAGAISMLAHMAQWAMIFGGGRRDDDERGGLVGGILMIILAPIAAALIQMAISRSREYEADATGARICGNPLALASALKKLQAGTADPDGCQSLPRLTMFIVEPTPRWRFREPVQRILRWRSASLGLKHGLWSTCPVTNRRGLRQFNWRNSRQFATEVQTRFAIRLVFSTFDESTATGPDTSLRIPRGSC
jgi:Zn-dependent protease with chaperone function